MAFPAIVGSVVESSTNTVGTSHIVNLPSLAAGNLALIFINVGLAAATFNALTGWTELLDEGIANGIAILYRECDGSEGASITLTSSGNTRSACLAYEISGAEDPATQAPQLSTVATGSDTNADPSTCTPTGGAKDYLWFAVAGFAGEELDDDTWVSVSPTDYTPDPPAQKACGTAGTALGGMITAASRQLNAASTDPGTFTNVSHGWRAYTVAVHPPAAAAGGFVLIGGKLVNNSMLVGGRLIF